MIVDVHTHCVPCPACVGEPFRTDAARVRASKVDFARPYADYPKTTGGAGVVSIVFGGKARLSGYWVDDADVAACVAEDPARRIGFMSLDPTQPGWREELERGHRELGLRGIKLMPMYAGFYPQDAKLDDLWRYVSRHNLPVLTHTGTTFVSKAPIDCTLPRHLDAVALKFPDARVILAHLGHPYEGECVAVIRKHRNLYADLSALHYRPWQHFHSLMLVHEYGVWDKVLFGSDYPVSTVEETLAGFRALGGIRVDRFALPKERIEEVIHRDTLKILGLSVPASEVGAAPRVAPTKRPAKKKGRA